MKRVLVGWMMVVTLFAVVSLPSMATAQKPPPFKVPGTVELLRDVTYGDGGGRALKMHILRAKEAAKEPLPVLVWIHGGGWRQGSKDSGLPLLAPFAARGYFCATIEYRLSGEAVFPAQIEDCKCAIRFLRAKAKEYNLDAEHIGVWGGSAGGHLVSLLGTSAEVKELEGKGGWPNFSSKVQAVCDFCGPTDLFQIIGFHKGTSSYVAMMLGGPPAENKLKVDLANPITHVTRDAAPFLIVHGDNDAQVPLRQSELLRDALKKAGVQVTLQIAEGKGHSLEGPKILRSVQEFFDKQLKAPAR